MKKTKGTTAPKGKKIRINPETLTFEHVKKTHSFQFGHILWIVLTAIAFGFAIILISTYFFPSPEEKKLQYDLAILEKNYKEINEKLERSLFMYNNLLDKERELDKLTFESEQKEMQQLMDEMEMYAPDFDFKKVLSITNSNIDSSASYIGQLIVKINILLDIAYGKQIFIRNLPAVLPVNKENMVLVSGFGERIHPIFKTLRPHNGIDFAARQGTPVVATGAGTVVSTPKKIEGLGNTVTIDHGFGYMSVYACLLRSEVRNGSKVKRGQVIGYVGKSGIASGPHLHYEIWHNGKPMNPINYFFLEITPAEFNNFKEKAAVKNQSMS